MSTIILHRRPLLTMLVIWLNVFFCQASFALFNNGFNACSDSFYGQVAPSYPNMDNQTSLYPLCFNGFAVLYSANSYSPVWSAEHLTKEKIYQANTLDRKDSFHIESRLPLNTRAELAHYYKSGYDRGHLAPNANMANRYQQYDSFSLANIVPQSPYLNRNVWKEIETDIRYFSKTYGDVYSITGILFANETASQTIKRLGNKVIVPSHVFKAVYIPATKQSGVYLATNDESGRVTMMSIDDLNQQNGINLMPALPIDITKRIDLPIENSKPFISGSSTLPQDNSTLPQDKLSYGWLKNWLQSIFSWWKIQLTASSD